MSGSESVQEHGAAATRVSGRGLHRRKKSRRRAEERQCKYMISAQHVLYRLFPPASLSANVHGHVRNIPSLGSLFPFSSPHLRLLPSLPRPLLTHDTHFQTPLLLKPLAYQFIIFLFLSQTTITTMSRVFRPKLSNPLHASDYDQNATSPLRPALKVRSSNMPRASLLTAISQMPVTISRGLHVRWSDPLCQVRTFLNPPQDSSPAPDVWEAMPPDATMVQGAPVSLHNARDEPLTTVCSPASLEDITRMNLLHLIDSKGIIVAPNFTVPVQPAPQLFSHPPQALHQSQQIPPALYTITTAQPHFMSTRSNHPNWEEVIENEPVTTTTDDSGSSAYMTESDSALPPPSHSSKRHRIVLTQSLKSNTPLFPKHKPKPPLTKPRIFEWANGLNRLWYLLEQGKYSQSDHDQLRSLLRSISEEKDRPGLGLMWLKDTKLIEILKKFKKDNRLQEFDPWVGHTAGQIIHFWRGRFTSSSA